MKSSEQNPKHNKPNQDQTNKEGNNTQNDFSASSQDTTPQNNKEGNNIRIEDNSTGLDYLREELKDRNRAIREKDNQVKELYQLLLKKNQQHPYTVLVAAILICLAIIFTTHRQDNQTTKTAYIAQSQPTSQDTSIYTKRLIKKLQKSNKKSHEASVKRIRIKPKHNPKDFKPNEMLEQRISGKASLLKPAGKHKHILRLVGDAIVVSLARDSSLINKSLRLYIRTNNMFDEPVKKLLLQDGAAYLFYKSDFRKGLYYVEIIQDQSDFTLFTGKFEVR